MDKPNVLAAQEACTPEDGAHTPELRHEEVRSARKGAQNATIGYEDRTWVFHVSFNARIAKPLNQSVLRGEDNEGSVALPVQTANKKE